MKKQITIHPGGEFGILFGGKKIIKVVANSQAAKAGVQVGWIILEVNGKKQPNDHIAIAQAIKKTHENGKPTMMLFGEVSSLPGAMPGNLGGPSPYDLVSTAHPKDKNRFQDVVSYLSTWLGQRPSMEKLEKMGILQNPTYFGVPLEYIVNTPLCTDGVPAILRFCCDYLSTKKPITTSGIFRIPPNTIIVQNLQRLLEELPQSAWQTGEGMPNLCDWDTHAIASVLKAYIRELPMPLCHFDTYEKLLKTADGDKTQITQIINNMIPIHRDSLNFLMRFLALVALNREFNFMTPQNLAIVFAPNVLRPRVDSPLKMAADCKKRIEVIKYIIEQREIELKKEFMAKGRTPPYFFEEKKKNKDCSPPIRRF